MTRCTLHTTKSLFRNYCALRVPFRFCSRHDNIIMVQKLTEAPYLLHSLQCGIHVLVACSVATSGILLKVYSRTSLSGHSEKRTHSLERTKF